MKKMRKISQKISLNEAYIHDIFGLDVTFDIGFREVIILKRKVQIYYVTGLCDSGMIQELLKVIVQINDVETNLQQVPAIIHNRLIHQQVERVNNMDEAADQILSGLIAVFVDGHDEAFIVDIRNYPGRTPEEPDTEKVIRGSRDGYTENIIENTALTRRRIRDVRLRNEMLQVGERSKTDVCISYIQDIATDGLIDLVKERIEAIEVDGLSMQDKSLEEYITRNKWNPFPLVRYTERPDVAVNHLLEGHVLIIVDASPSVIILPTTYFHHLQHAEEYRQSPAFGTFVRWTRFIGVLASLYLLPLWLLFTMEPQLLPKEFAFIGPNEIGNIPIFVQIILADIGVEFLRMAAVHTPTPLSTAMGLIAAVLIGQIAIDVGLFSPEVILYVSISAIGSYVTPSYELGAANKLMKYMLIISTILLGAQGLIIGFTITILYLVSLKSLKTPYFWPLLPLNLTALVHIIFRLPVTEFKKRPSIVHPKNDYRKPPN